MQKSDSQKFFWASSRSLLLKLKIVCIRLHSSYFIRLFTVFLVFENSPNLWFVILDWIFTTVKSFPLYTLKTLPMSSTLIFSYRCLIFICISKNLLIGIWTQIYESVVHYSILWNISRIMPKLSFKHTKIYSYKSKKRFRACITKVVDCFSS